MIQGLSVAINPLLASAGSAVMAGADTSFSAQSPLLGLGEESITINPADLHLEHLGARSMWDNAGLDRHIHSSHRSLAARLTAPLHLDTQLRHIMRDSEGTRVRLHIPGDVADTPSVSEVKSFEAILGRYPELLAEGFNRGNHDDGRVFNGVVNLKSRVYKWVRKWIFGDRVDTLEEQRKEASGGAGRVLTSKKTFEAMHRILHRHRYDKDTPIEKINTAVSEASFKGYRLCDSNEYHAFTEENRTQNLRTFWHASKGTQLGSTEESPFWDCLVNYQVAGLDADKRGTKVTPFYIQASQEARVPGSDGREVPVYSISIDTADTDNPIAVFPGISELQMRLIETFIDHVRQHQPGALFKINSHFPAERVMQGAKGILRKTLGLINPPVSRKVRKAFKRLLSREEIIRFTGAHTHARKVSNLTETLGLDRTTPLYEVVFPSLADYVPVQVEGNERPHDGRALGIERMWAERTEGGKHALRLTMEFQGLDPEELCKTGLTPAVQEAVNVHNRDHGYQKTLDTMLEKFGKVWQLGLGGWFGRQLLWGFTKNRFKSIFRFLHSMVLPLPLMWLPFFWKRAGNYWFEQPSILQDFKEIMTTASTEQVLNEAEHLLPFLKSLTAFMEEETVAGDLAAEAMLQGVREVYAKLTAQLNLQRFIFDSAVGQRKDASQLAQYNDLLERAEVFRLPSLLTGLKEGGQARAFALMVGLESSRVEYEFQGLKPTKVPNDVLNITVPLG